ncbi:autorepressor SdpR family transcription factor [Vagococcus lutrae]|uniref:autorepressor SdpR family transcription factor n=1 Tax=Vagococcus lutrae TaxID=81947 RepID=UPI001C986938|nr:autorepressor SdpR family transcription factor [Vagococcus lutrae]QZN88787.1 autorepressor SdpR family transcription factor [Vagococcus lutrae]
MSSSIELFKAIGHPIRYEIIMLLKKGPLAAGEISSHFPLSPATISHHLKQLKEANMIRERKDKNFIIYELNLSVFQEAMIWFQSFI